MTLEQTPVRRDSPQFAYNRGVLEITCCKPYFDNAKILFRRYGDTIYVREQRVGVGYSFTHYGVRQLFPSKRNIGVGHFISKAPSISISRVFPYRRNPAPHYKQHAVHN